MHSFRFYIFRIQHLQLKKKTLINKIIVILNHNNQIEVSGKVNYKGADSFDDLIPIKMPSGTLEYKKGKFNLRFAPSDIAVFWCTKQASQNK